MNFVSAVRNLRFASLGGSCLRSRLMRVKNDPIRLDLAVKPPSPKGEVYNKVKKELK